MPPRQRSEDYYQQEFALRKLSDAVEVLTEQAEKNAADVRSNREDILVIKTKIAFVAGGAGLVGGAIVATVVKLLTH